MHDPIAKCLDGTCGHRSPEDCSLIISDRLRRLSKWTSKATRRLKPAWAVEFRKVCEAAKRRAEAKKPPSVLDKMEAAIATPEAA